MSSGLFTICGHLLILLASVLLASLLYRRVSFQKLTLVASVLGLIMLEIRLIQDTVSIFGRLGLRSGLCDRVVLRSGRRKLELLSRWHVVTALSAILVMVQFVTKQRCLNLNGRMLFAATQQRLVAGENHLLCPLALRSRGRAGV